MPTQGCCKRKGSCGSNKLNSIEKKTPTVLRTPTMRPCVNVKDGATTKKKKICVPPSFGGSTTSNGTQYLVVLC